MLFVEDLQPLNTRQTPGCAVVGTACGNTNDEALAIVDMTGKGLTENEHLSHMARTMAHEFGHLVSIVGVAKKAPL